MADESAVRTNLLGLPPEELAAFVVGLGEKPFRARQLLTWIYKRRIGDFEQMTDLGKDLRARLAAVAERRLVIDHRRVAKPVIEMILLEHDLRIRRQNLAGVAHPFANAMDHRHVLDGPTEDHERGLATVRQQPVLRGADTGIEQRASVGLGERGVLVHGRYHNAAEFLDRDMRR